jgi:hypothetical protein
MHPHEHFVFPRNRALDLLQAEAVWIQADYPHQ